MSAGHFAAAIGAVIVGLIGVGLTFCIEATELIAANIAKLPELLRKV